MELKNFREFVTESEINKDIEMNLNEDNVIKVIYTFSGLMENDLTITYKGESTKVNLKTNQATLAYINGLILGSKLLNGPKVVVIK